MTRREPYAGSFARFIDLTGGSGRPRPDPAKRPRHDDDDPGPSLFRTAVQDCALARLTLPGLFIGRSELVRVDFTYSDLRRSTLCWNDFTEVWFTSCDLEGADLRASAFVGCDFRKASLVECDLRHSTFERCRFDEALLTGALVPSSVRDVLGLSDEQAAAAGWVDDEGDEPSGG